MSRRHAEIRKVGSAFFLVDLDSRNKTFLNEIALMPQVPSPLNENDRIKICDVEFVYSSGEPRKVNQPELTADLMMVTEGDGKENADFVTLEACAFDHDGERGPSRG